MAKKLVSGPRQYAALSSAWFLTSIVGLVISAGYVWKFSPAWGLSFGVIFAAMFVASMVSMRRGSPDDQLRARPKRK